MTTTQFCYWLQGSIELNKNDEFNEEQTKIVKNHLDMVFEHIAHLDEKDQPEPTPDFMNYGHLERC